MRKLGAMNKPGALKSRRAKTRPTVVSIPRVMSEPRAMIPFNRPCLIGTERAYVHEAFANGQISGDGPFTRKCHELLEKRLGVPKVLLTTSCTHALEMAALLLDLRAGDEVIVPSYTFVSTVNAFVLRGATPIFAD